jgi:hypothetical protein
MVDQLRFFNLPVRCCHWLGVSPLTEAARAMTSAGKPKVRHRVIFLVLRDPT